MLKYLEREGINDFRLVQPYQHHTRIPEKHIYVYSFGLRPEEHQPSGTCNFSRIDNAQLVFDLTNIATLNNVSAGDTGQISIYATNYNVLRIMSGMGGQQASVVQAMAQLKIPCSGNVLRALFNSTHWKRWITNSGNTTSHIINKDWIIPMRESTVFCY